MKRKISRGSPCPIGASVTANGTNFSIFVENATAVELLFFDHKDDKEPSEVIHLGDEYCSFSYWHVFVENIFAGQLYAYRVHTHQSKKHSAHSSSPANILLDPYAKGFSHNAKHTIMRSVVIDDSQFDWSGDAPLSIPDHDVIIYEMHLAGFTKSPTSGLSEDLRGTYAGLIQKIPYLKSLGVTSVELMPVQQFDESSSLKGLTNYWGYNPMAFFAVHMGYGSTQDPVSVRNEFKSMVKALHAANIEVILDVVFNHTSEGNHKGPTHSFKEIANKTYYMLEKDRHHYKNYSGCGNTLNANNSVVRRMILDCLRSWVVDMHVDGFRFDLASTFSRDKNGHLLSEPPIIWDIETDPILCKAKIIAEPWDAAGLYQVGSFPGHRWMEWNGKFRDDARRFIKGDCAMTPSIAARIVGSADFFGRSRNAVSRSINFVTCHDGFTLHDLVSYNHKHNLANGENNHDGAHQNDSWNCGTEGESDNTKIKELRLKQSKNLIALLFLSQGTPMFLMGDEAGRTQQGNNNAYCHDNELSWFDWDRAIQYQELFDFTQKMITVRKQLAIFKTKSVWTTTPNKDDIVLKWHGVHQGSPDWSHDSRTIAFEINAVRENERIYVAMNTYWESITFELPNGHWSVLACTDASFTTELLKKSVQVPARSLILLKSY